MFRVQVTPLGAGARENEQLAVIRSRHSRDGACLRESIAFHVDRVKTFKSKANRVQIRRFTIDDAALFLSVAFLL